MKNILKTITSLKNFKTKKFELLLGIIILLFLLTISLLASLLFNQYISNSQPIACEQTQIPVIQYRRVETYDFLDQIQPDDRDFFLNLDKQDIKVSPDGKWLTFIASGYTKTELDAGLMMYLLKPSESMKKRTRFFYSFSDIFDENYSFSPDGKYLAARANNFYLNSSGVIIFDISGEHRPRLVLSKTKTYQPTKAMAEYQFENGISSVVWKNNEEFLINIQGKLQLMNVSGEVLKVIDTNVVIDYTGDRWYEQILPEFSPSKRYVIYIKKLYTKIESFPYIIKDLTTNSYVVLPSPYELEVGESIPLSNKEKLFLKNLSDEYGTKIINLPFSHSLDTEIFEFVDAE